jgi:hypothetical protein
MNQESVTNFESFLAGRLAFTKFITNCLAYRTILERLYEREYEEVILGAFAWECSPEGFYYWKALSDGWMEYTRTLN